MPERISAWAIYDVFSTADNESVFVGVVSDTQWQTFCDAFGLDELAADEALKRNQERVQQRDRIIPMVSELFAKLSKQQLMDKLERSGLPFAPIARPQDLFDDPHLQASGGLLDIALPSGEATQLPNLPLALQGERPALRQGLPSPGEHTETVLKEAGYQAAQIEQLRADGVI